MKSETSLLMPDGHRCFLSCHVSLSVTAGLKTNKHFRLSSVKLTLMFSASTLAPASSRMWAASTFPASTAQCSGVFLFTLSTALTEALFLIRKLVGSGLEQKNVDVISETPDTSNWDLNLSLSACFYV